MRRVDDACAGDHYMAQRPFRGFDVRIRGLQKIPPTPDRTSMTKIKACSPARTGGPQTRHLRRPRAGRGL